ncbi:hypothetical protein EG346_00880 [Chryseobacterium carnipullorum]|uniref:Uncharacterized protein n=1 Tax=Chryseobacterium carnipullorum TaxID=1124835 RepID=A0A376ED38_CHRCU|nr:hypothetical protein [Chryseobacterium carnipullorum]AZA46857.1 hypothetical protein EG346_00880 [Chryseobacterium carnipullorum]AZA66216.1 hypothetical protein EG345_16965 [Chryseobacterium carnipullorum]STD06366.1 Uncharacterised protein [Chryseobacterium carnipullorum]
MKKFLSLLILILGISTLYCQNTDEALCQYFSKDIKEKPLKCMDRSKLKDDEVIYQFFKWSAFKEDYLIRIEKKGKVKTIVKKKIYKSGYNQKTGEYQEPRVEILKEDKLTNDQFKRFSTIITKNNFWQKTDYKVESMCMDGGGILVFALRKDQYLEINNGNCSPNAEYLNHLYQELITLFNL